MTPLQPGDMLQWFRIERVLGRGGFGITYLATDTNLDHSVAIKEYAPDLHVHRASDQSLQPVGEVVSGSYQTGLDRFISEARTLVKFNHPSIVRIITVFPWNNTAYLVMDFEEGEVFSKYAQAHHPVNESRLKDIFIKLIDGLLQVHERGFLHRDIKPGNIIIRRDGDPVLLDFGCARPALLPDSNTHTAFVTPGYSPLEQFHSIAGLEEGPWTDIYALSATLHFAITRQTPTNSASRLSALSSRLPDPLRSATEAGAEHYSREFLEAIDWGLQPIITDRPESLAQWRNALTARRPPDINETVLLPGTKPVDSSETVMQPKTAHTDRSTVPSPATRRAPPPTGLTGLSTDSRKAPWDDLGPALQERPPTKRSNTPVAAAVSVLLLILGGAGGYWWLSQQPKTTDTTADLSSSGNSTAEPAELDDVVQLDNVEQPQPDPTPAVDTAQSSLISTIAGHIESTNLRAARTRLNEPSALALPDTSRQPLLDALQNAEADKRKLDTVDQLLGAGNFGDALTVLDTIKSDSVFQSLATELGAVATEMQRREQRQADALEAQQRQASLARAQRETAQVIESLQEDLYLSRFSSARQLAQQSTGLAPDNLQLQAQIDLVGRSQEFESILAQAKGALNNNDTSAAQNYLTQATSFNISNAQLNELTQALGQLQASATRATTLLTSADQALADKQWRLAVQRYQEAETLTPGNSFVRQGLARTASQWLKSAEADISQNRFNTAAEALTDYQNLLGSSAELQRLQRLLHSTQAQYKEHSNDLKLAANQIAQQQYQRAIDTLDKTRPVDNSTAGQLETLRESATTGLRDQTRLAQEQQRQNDLQQQKLREKTANNTGQYNKQPTPRVAAPIPDATRYRNLLASAEQSLAAGDLKAAETLLEQARSTGLQNELFSQISLRYNKALIESQRPKLSTAQAITQAQTRFQQLAKAVVNRNEKAVGLLTEGSGDKLDLMRALFGKYKQIDVEISNLERSNDSTVSAVLQLQRLSLADGTTTIPADSWRQHQIQVEYGTDGWSKIRW